MSKCCFKLNEKLFDFGGGGCEGYEEVANYAALPATGETDIIYKTLDDGKIYEWNGSAYVELVEQSTPIGATLMKTGQTTSYRTGDDGDIEAGRATDFFTLESNNPFGNNKRFTGITGGYYIGGVNYNKDGGTTTSVLAFPNDIVIDWSTYNGINALGYYRRLLNTGGVTYDFNWGDAIDKALAHSVTGFTSGWRLWNKGEVDNIVNIEYSNGFTPPFDNASGGQIEAQSIWTSSTLKASITQAWYTQFYGAVNYGAKSGSRRVVAVRDFTVTGTTLT